MNFKPFERVLLYEIWTNLKKKEYFQPEMHTCVKELIKSEEVHFLVLFFIFIFVMIIIGVIKYLVWFMRRKLSIHVSKQNEMDHLLWQYKIRNSEPVSPCSVYSQNG